MTTTRRFSCLGFTPDCPVAAYFLPHLTVTLGSSQNQTGINVVCSTMMVSFSLTQHTLLIPRQSVTDVTSSAAPPPMTWISVVMFHITRPSSERSCKLRQIYKGRFNHNRDSQQGASLTLAFDHHCSLDATVDSIWWLG